MFETHVQTSFHSAHHLYRYGGECANLHGHTWRVEMALVGDELDRTGMLCDFKEMKALLNEVVRPFDHDYINQVPPFDDISPTAENLARFIYLQMKKEFAKRTFKLSAITVWESEKASATYREP